VLVEPTSGTILPVSFNSIFDSVLDLKNRLTGEAGNCVERQLLSGFLKRLSTETFLGSMDRTGHKIITFFQRLLRFFAIAIILLVENRWIITIL
jgi:hypothetical protein